MSLEQLDDKELYDRLHKAGLAEKLKSSEEWQLVKEAANRIVEKAIREFISADPSDMVHIAQLQIIFKKYKYNLFSEVDAIERESKMLYEEAVDRGLIGGEGPNLT